MNRFKILPAAGMPAAALLAFLFGTSTGIAQDAAVAPLPQSINGVLEQAGIPVPPEAKDPSSIESFSRPESPFQYSPFVLTPHFLYRFLYEYGVLAQRGRPVTSLIDTFAPGIGLQAGDHWTFDYTANWDVYSNHTFTDTLGHTAVLIGKESFDNWTAMLSQSYTYSAQPLVETGVQTTIQEYRTSLDVSHQLTQSILEETVLSQDLRLARSFTDTYQWTVDQWVHYRFSTEVDAAVGGGAGYVHESQGSDSNYTEPEAQISWQPASKVDISLSGGLQHRVFLDYPRSSLDTPTYDLSFRYTPFEATKLTLEVIHQVSPSLFGNESTRLTKENLNVSQRIMGKFFLIGAIGNNGTDYIFDSQSNISPRNDTQLTYSLKLSRPFAGRGTVSIFSYRSRNASSELGYGFTTTQFGLELSYRY